MGWDARLRVPRWVAERITREGSRGGGDRSAHVFREDDGGGRGGGGGGGGGRGGRGRRGGGGGGASAPAAAAPAEGDAPDPEDPGLDPRWRSTNAHYLASGFDRGHCAPAADFKGHPEALAASFVLSNVAPQVGPGMNRDYWARFERFVKTLATGAGGGGGGGGERSGSGDGEREVVVFTGPLYLPRRVKPGRGAPPNAPRYEMRHPMLGDPPRLVAVPTHFYKVALVLEKGKKKEEERKTGGDVNGDGSENGGGGGENGGGGVGGARARAIGAWVMPNAAIPPETPLTVFCVPLSALEDAAGGRFFQGVVDEEGVPRRRRWRRWRRGRRRRRRSRSASTPPRSAGRRAGAPPRPSRPRAGRASRRRPRPPRRCCRSRRSWQGCWRRRRRKRRRRRRKTAAPRPLCAPRAPPSSS